MQSITLIVVAWPNGKAEATDAFVTIVKSKVEAVQSGGKLASEHLGETHWCKIFLDSGREFTVAGNYATVNDFLDLN